MCVCGLTAPLPLQARSYLNKLPEKFAEDDLILITDPMLATGGTMMQVSSLSRNVITSAAAAAATAAVAAVAVREAGAEA